MDTLTVVTRPVLIKPWHVMDIETVVWSWMKNFVPRKIKVSGFYMEVF